MEVSVMAALDNIRAAVNIKVVITQRQALEDNFFSKAANDFSNGRRMTLINLPSGATDLMWLAKLDAEALSGNSASLLKQKRRKEKKNKTKQNKKENC